MLLEDNFKTIKDAKLDIELLRRKNEKECVLRNAEIDELQSEIKRAELELEADLKESGEKKLECKLGWCSFRVQPDKWTFKDDDIIKEIEIIYSHLIDKYIRVVKSLKLDELKKDLVAGEINLKRWTKEPQEPKFGYKINGGL